MAMMRREGHNSDDWVLVAKAGRRPMSRPG